MQEVLAVRSVSKSYPGVTALRDVSFSLRSGEIRGLCGENGAGKSTFVKILMGIVQPDSGSIAIDGHIQVVAVEAQPLWRIVRRIPALFRGTLRPEPGLIMRAVERATIAVDGPVAVHVDGEARIVEGSIEVGVRPSALTVLAP